MPHYRFYLLTADDHIALRREADCDNDAHAIAKAAEVIGHYPALEVWDGPRRLTRLAATDILKHQQLSEDKLLEPPE
jgi:hypothetical protein